MVGALTDQRVASAIASGGTSTDCIYKAIEKQIQKYACSGAVLDYGAGRGVLTRKLIESGRFTEVKAVDLWPIPPQIQGVQWISQDLNEPSSLPEQSFDLVVAAEVIEHLENPRFVVRQLFRLCKPGGRIILTMPNNESIRSLIALVVRGHHVAFDDSCYPAHITALLRKDLTRIFHEAGFETPNFSYTLRGALPGFTRFNWQGLSMGMLDGVLFRDGILATAARPREF